MMQARGIIVLTADPVRRSTKNGQVYATARAVVPAIEPGTVPVELNLVAFGAVAERLLALSAGAMVAVRGRLAGTTWAGRDGEQRHGLRLTVEELDRAPADPARLEAPRHAPELAR
jgi:single-stranded DNA-binding protein